MNLLLIKGYSYATQTSANNRHAIKNRVTQNMESKNAAMKKRNKMGNLMGAQGMQTAGLGQLMGMNMGVGLGMNTNMAGMMPRINPQAQYKKAAISNNALRTGTQLKN